MFSQQLFLHLEFRHYSLLVMFWFFFFTLVKQHLLQHHSNEASKTIWIFLLLSLSGFLFHCYCCCCCSLVNFSFKLTTKKFCDIFTSKWLYYMNVHKYTQINCTFHGVPLFVKCPQATKIHGADILLFFLILKNKEKAIKSIAILICCNFFLLT